MPNITLTTLNAKYIHASLGLRYLFANMGELQQSTRLREFTIIQRADEIVEQLLNDKPEIIGFGVYIWNSIETLQVVKLLKTISPKTSIILGGPEVSFETTEQELFKVADHVITGQADFAFADCCRDILVNSPPGKLVSPLPFALDMLSTPYIHYDDDDIKNRVLYVEASRGCPFKCEFCLSSLDKTAVAFDLDIFLTQMKKLIDKGARQFKFIDRTFNLKIETSCQILAFFLNEMETLQQDIFLHFELIPDRLPDAIKLLLPNFPKGTLQFEIGIQSFNPEVQARISRKQNHERTCSNLAWLRAHTHAHIHTDLIFGLPGETLESFGNGFNQLIALEPQEIQVGILKRLRGTPIARHTDEYSMRYMDSPPYRILANTDNDFNAVQRMVRFARYWDLIANSGRFPNSLPLLLEGDPFERFMTTSDWLYSKTGQTHRIALQNYFPLLRELLTEHFQLEESVVETALLADYHHNKLKGLPAFARKEYTSKKRNQTNKSTALRSQPSGGAKRQGRHVASVEH